jgi:hypothetical protein
MSKRYGSLLDRFWRNTIKGDGCWLWIGPKDDFGYGRLRNGARRVRAHRLSYEMFRCSIPADKFVLHSCDNPACVNPEHLRVGTALENVQDKVHRYRQTKGEASPWAKLQTEQVIAIKSADGTDRALAQQYGVSHSVISAIRRGVKWKHIQRPAQ